MKPDYAASSGSDEGLPQRRFVASARTNLPRWPDAPPPIDPGGRGFVLVGVGGDAKPVVDRWAADVAEAGLPCRAMMVPDAPAGPALLDWLDGALAQAVVGWRLMLAGPPSAVLSLASRARAAGMIDAEISTFAIDDGAARLQCAHCKTLFCTQARPGDDRVCPSCGRTLMVHQHLSRRLGALVGFLSDSA